MLAHTTDEARKIPQKRVERLNLRDGTAADSWILFTIPLSKDVTLEISERAIDVMAVGVTFIAMLVVIQESIYEIFTRVNCYKMEARFTRGRSLRTIRRLSNYTRYFTTVFITSAPTFICTQGKKVTFTSRLVINVVCLVLDSLFKYMSYSKSLEYLCFDMHLECIVRISLFIYSRYFC